MSAWVILLVFALPALAEERFAADNVINVSAEGKWDCNFVMCAEKGVLTLTALPGICESSIDAMVHVTTVKGTVDLPWKKMGTLALPGDWSLAEQVGPPTLSDVVRYDPGHEPPITQSRGNCNVMLDDGKRQEGRAWFRLFVPIQSPVRVAGTATARGALPDDLYDNRARMAIIYDDRYMRPDGLRGGMPTPRLPADVLGVLPFEGELR